MSLNLGAVGRMLADAQRSPFLIIVRAGRESLHARYCVEGRDRRFDVLIAEYQDGVKGIEAAGVAHIAVPGPKVGGLAEIFRDRPEIFDRYSHIALIDDDIDADAAALSACFETGERLGLDIWQPSLTWDSHFSYAAFLRLPGFQARYTNFIEMMCPFFSAGALKRCAPLFSCGYETGIDLIWCRTLPSPLYRTAILDCVSVRHTRDIGATKTLNGFAAHETYDRQIEAFLRAHNVTFCGNVVYAGLDRSGRLLKGRLAMAARTLGLLGAAPRAPGGPLVVVRTVSDHIRHILSRPLNLDPVEGLTPAIQSA